jgi:hypothetical protein
MVKLIPEPYKEWEIFEANAFKTKKVYAGFVPRIPGSKFHLQDCMASLWKARPFLHVRTLYS